MPWLVRGDDVLAAAEVAVTRKVRRRDSWAVTTSTVCSCCDPAGRCTRFGMQFPIDVAFCDRYGFVLHVSELKPGRVSRFVFRSYFAIEATAGSFDRWQIHLGDVVEVKG